MTGTVPVQGTCVMRVLLFLAVWGNGPQGLPEIRLNGLWIDNRVD